MASVTAEQVEKAIEFPAPGQVDLLLDFEWLVPMVDGRVWGQYASATFPSNYLFTSPQRFEPLKAENRRGKEFETNPYPLTTPDGWQIVRPMTYESELDRCELVPTPGREVFKRIVSRGDYHTVFINSGCARYDEGRLHGVLRMPSGWTALLAQGIDPRPETRILPAQSIAEIHLCMRQLHSVVDLTHRLEYIDDELAAVYEGINQQQKPMRQAFTLVTAMEEPNNFGPGVSQILCGASMAYWIDFHLSTVRENFHLGTRLGMYESMPRILREIEEVIKMLDPKIDQLPPECFRAEYSGSFVKTKPHVITGKWLRETRQKFVDFVRDFPSEAPR